jgi:uncharacterized protein with HEPN domain
MPPDEAISGLLWDMLVAARHVVRFVNGKSYDEYLSDLLLRSGVRRQAATIGEAASKVSKTFRDGHPEIPWGPIIAQRHILGV